MLQVKTEGYDQAFTHPGHVIHTAAAIHALRNGKDTLEDIINITGRNVEEVYECSFDETREYFEKDVFEDEQEFHEVEAFKTDVQDPHFTEKFQQAVITKRASLVDCPIGTSDEDP